MIEFEKNYFAEDVKSQSSGLILIYFIHQMDRVFLEGFRRDDPGVTNLKNSRSQKGFNNYIKLKSPAKTF